MTLEQDVSRETIKMTKVQLAPNVKLTGGRISGELIGDEMAPAHVSNMLVNADSKLENVILGDNVEIADEDVCAVKQLAATASPENSDTTETDNLAIILDTQGKQSDGTASFDTQLITQQGKRRNKAVLSQAEAKTVNLTTHVTVAAEHQNKAADLLIVAQYKNAQQTVSYMKTATGWKIWDGQLSHLQPLETYQQLPGVIDSLVFSGDMSQQSGEFSIYTGYRLTDDGRLVFNGRNPLRFAVGRVQESCSLSCGCQ
ncbi:MAG: hypothetical protein R3E08_07740 [Thiotrichaceae bacterium]